MSTCMCSCTVRLTTFSTAGKFQLASNFTELHALTLAAHSYLLLSGYTTHFWMAMTFKLFVLYTLNCMMITSDLWGYLDKPGPWSDTYRMLVWKPDSSACEGLVPRPKEYRQFL